MGELTKKGTLNINIYIYIKKNTFDKSYSTSEGQDESRIETRHFERVRSQRSGRGKVK